MKLNSLSLLMVFLVGILIISCSNNDSNPAVSSVDDTSELGKSTLTNASPVSQAEITNGDMENGRTGYWAGGTSGSSYDTEYTDAESQSPSHSLSIIANNGDENSFAFWAQTFDASQYLEKKITMM